MKKIKVLIVDDSAFMRNGLFHLINAQFDMEVVGTAENGLVALSKTMILKPDVVIMDIEMPVMNGLAALHKIVQGPVHPKVLMFSSLTKEGAKITFEALEVGAYDFVEKGQGLFSSEGELGRRKLLEKIRCARNLNPSVMSRAPFVGDYQTNKAIGRAEYSAAKKFVLIGSSTGGPQALSEVVPGFSGELDAAVVVSQHIPENFVDSLSERLNRKSQILVKKAENGELLKEGVCYITPGNAHFGLRRTTKGYVVHLNYNRGGQINMPAVDVMIDAFRAQSLESQTIVVILSGMGRDGTAGLQRLESKKPLTIVQNEGTCVVYGMPGSVSKAGMADLELEVSLIGSRVERELRYIRGDEIDA